MTLPSPDERDSWSEWKNYHKITTSTFNLSPVEKPDFSPFLIHMTGKDSLVNILKGENAPEGIKIKDNEGYLKAVIPDVEGKKYYNSEVVCFTETPIFALDFFRYKSFNRWRRNQQFGIGFSKADLVIKRGVRPVVYFESKTNGQLLNLCNHIIDGNYSIVNSKGKVLNYQNLFEKMKPLLFPLLEDVEAQGFMWEREWRCPDKKGLVFSHSEIEVICCPSNERAEIEEILGELIEQIQVVESWREYDDVTTYLKRRQKETDSEEFNRISQIKNIDLLIKLKSQNEQTLNALSTYYGVFKETTDSLEKRDINQMLENIKKKSQEIDEQIKIVEEENKIKAEQTKVKNTKEL